ncbi:uncharacterized protein LOC113206347 isoform X2 [Frankliniella occidentalis]|uniref:Uncharacterized protein LOC113206347 isoform X2 n=1 Tax=Frankliniella occidentalis TaxID=133901 RepID=A0A9C6TS22_FRAOC|nr:uncharacterized protein LOC113206347 isoform X2 [Frankliniella occidentalis]
MDCNICFEPFDQGGHLPKAIPCGHTVCLQCLQRLQNRKCPTCQQVFQAPLSQIPNNYTVLQLLQARSDRTDKSPGWCSRCSAVATPQCRGQQHVVLGVREALEQLLQGALPQAAGHLERLKNQCQEEEAVQALALLSGGSWEVTLRGEGPPLSATLRDSEDPLTKAFLLFLATKAKLKAAATVQIKNSTKTTSLVHRNDLSPLSPNLAGNLNVSSEITNSICTRVLDCAKDLRSSDLAGNLLVFRGVQRLLNVTKEVAPHLPIAEPTVQQLSLSPPTSLTALRAALAMSRLKRLRVGGGINSSMSFHEEVSAAGASLSQGLTDAPARLQWLELIGIPCDLLPLLLPAHRLTLQVLQLEPGHKTVYPSSGPFRARLMKQHVTCNQLLSLLAQCDLRALQKLVLVDALPIDHSSSETCARQRGLLRAALPAGARVLCWKCNGDRCREVF